MGTKFWEAFSLLRSNPGLIAAIVLAVWLPGNLLLNHFYFTILEFGDDAQMRMGMWIEGLFGPIYIGALAYALFEIKSGRKATYGASMIAGLRNWGVLWVAHLVSGIFILLGCVALIVPGMMLVVRYSLIAPVVVLEKKGVSDALGRSTELTIGRRWQIFGALVLGSIVVMLFSFLVYLPYELHLPLNTYYLVVFADCVTDVAFTFIQILMFLFYWEAVQETQDEDMPEMADFVGPQDVLD